MLIGRVTFGSAATLFDALSPAVQLMSFASRLALAPVAAHWRRLSAVLFSGVLALLLLFEQGAAFGAEVAIGREFQIKATFLANIPKFVEWPADSFATIDAPLVIGVLGPRLFGDRLALWVKGRKINGRNLVVLQVDTVEAAQASHLLYVSNAANPRFWLMRNELQGSAILTVGESATFIAAGGSIRFVPVGDRLRFEINMSAAERARLKISSQLQKLATTVSRMP